MSDDLDRMLAVEEHRQGMPFTGDPGHCGGCRTEHVRRLVAACTHEETVEMRAMEDQFPVVVCAFCGTCLEGGE